MKIKCKFCSQLIKGKEILRLYCSIRCRNFENQLNYLMKMKKEKRNISTRGKR